MDVPVSDPALGYGADHLVRVGLPALIAENSHVTCTNWAYALMDENVTSVMAPCLKVNTRGFEKVSGPLLMQRLYGK